MALKQELQQKLQQKLSTSQIQAIKMLEFPTLEMEERIAQELQENPALEEGTDEEDLRTDELDDMPTDEPQNEGGGDDHDFDIDPYISDDEVPDYRLKTNNQSRDEERVEIPFSAGQTFQENLLDQLGLLHISDSERHLAELVIGNLDTDGYLRRTVESMVDDLAFQEGISCTDSEMEHAISVVQQLDPAGIGARDLRECLLLQLERRQPTAETELATRILTQCFDAFSKKHYEKIAEKLNLTDEQIKDAIREIVKLNPKPGSAWGGNLYEKNLTAIIPDFQVENDGGQLTVTLNNSNLPELRINRQYTQMLRDYSGNKANQTSQMRDALAFMKQKAESAQWFIDAIRQRNNTLLIVMNAIVRFQHDFFIEGDESCLRPMVLQDIAERTGFDSSTISRVSNSKYVETEFGIYPLKYFFSESFTDVEGNEVSNKAIRSLISEFLAKEDKRNPLTDDQLVKLLQSQGFNIARRTIAKYRELMHVPSSRLRREI